MDSLNQHWQAVLFDVGGVIARQDTEAANRALAERWPDLTAHDVRAARELASLYPLWEDYSRGLTAPDVYWGAVLIALGRADGPDDVAAMRAIQRDTLWALIDVAVLDLVRGLRAGTSVRLGVLSNSAVDYEGHIARFADAFDDLAFSHRIGLRKPDPRAYRYAADALRTPMDRIVFIDDKVRNVEAAARLGMNALRFRDAASLHADLASAGLTATA